MGNNNNFFKMLVGEVPLGREEEYYNFSLLPDLESYNRADTVNMNDEEMNVFRHTAGSKQALNDLGLPRGIAALMYKGFQDVKRDRNWADAGHDFKNDMRAVGTFITNPSLSGDELYDYSFQKYIKPNR